MHTAVAILYLIAVALLALAGLGLVTPRANLVVLAAACALLAFSLPAIAQL